MKLTKNKAIGALVVAIATTSMFFGVSKAQEPTLCKVVSHSNITMFERLVAGRIDQGWDVKGGMSLDSTGATVLMCSK